MPELPEVETVRGGLEKLIVGKQVLSVECLCKKSLPVSLADVRQIIVGATIMAVRRRAKMLIIDLTGDYSLLVHLKMTGQMVYRGEEDIYLMAIHSSLTTSESLAGLNYIEQMKSIVCQ